MLSRLLDIIAPESCLECQVEGSIWCDWCRLQYDCLPSRCFVCHATTANFEVCQKCRKTTSLSSVYVYGEYKGINKQLVQLLKFDCKRHIATPMARSMGDALPYFGANTVLVPVPSASSHIRLRGFDQTVVLAKELSKHKGLKINNLLIRTNHIRQVGSTKALRKKQIAGAFRVSIGRKGLLPDHIVLVDDVVTTGATLSEASKVLKQSGIKRVDAVVFCYS